MLLTPEHVFENFERGLIAGCPLPLVAGLLRLVTDQRKMLSRQQERLRRDKNAAKRGITTHGRTIKSQKARTRKNSCGRKNDAELCGILLQRARAPHRSL